MATLAEIRAAAEQFRDDHASKFVRRQNAYFAAHGRYWQGIATPALIPDDGASRSPDLSTKPHDQAETWADSFTGADALPASWPVRMSVDVYNGPSGHGWSVTVLVSKAGTTYMRTWNVGPEIYRETGWVTRAVGW